MSETILPPARPVRLILILFIVLALLVGGGGIAAAAYRFDLKHRTDFPQGVMIEGIDLSALTYGEAVTRVYNAFSAPLDRPLSIEVDGRTVDVTPRELGVRNDALSRLREASILHRSLPWWQRLWNRTWGIPDNVVIRVRTTFDEGLIERFVEELAASAERPARDASIEVHGDRLELIPARAGFAVDRSEGVRQIRQAISSRSSRVALEGKVTPPTVNNSAFSTALVIKVGENKLYHYRDMELVKVYDVATGVPRYPTPKGLFKVVNKRKNPTWGNPAKYPGGWGWSLPARIGPGPGNPLGTRALDLSAPGIRIHGTYAAYSVGYNASHGCIRMRIRESEELFDLVGVGTPVLIVQSGPNRVSSRPAPTTPEPTAENDGTPVPGQPSPSPQPSSSPTQPALPGG